VGQKKFHIKSDGTIQECGMFVRCDPQKVSHWGTRRAAEIYLDNRAYEAEVAAKIAHFKNISQPSHPSHFQVSFVDRSRDNARRTRERFDQYVINTGQYPEYISGYMRVSLEHWQHDNESLFEIKSILEIEPEHGMVSRYWVFRALDYDGHKYIHNRKQRLLKEAKLDFTDHRSFEDNIEEIKAVHKAALWSTVLVYDVEDFNDLHAPMIAQFWKMFDTVETLAQGEWELWQEVGRGDFRESTDELIFVLANYEGSVFTGQSFTNFLSKLYRPHTYRYDMRVTDEVEGHPRASWSLLFRGDQWYYAESKFNEPVDTYILSDAEQIRSHVYWHVFNEIDRGKQEIALKKSQYAVDFYNAVELGMQEVRRKKAELEGSND
jgi:hypothetical protein